MASSSKMTMESSSLLIVTFLDIERRIFRLLLKFSLVFTSLLLVRSNWSRCSPSSSMISEPIWSVSAAIRWERSILWVARFRLSVPCRSNALYCAHLHMKCSPDISNFLEKISSLSHSVVFLYFFACSLRKAFLCLLALLWNCIQMIISFLFSRAFSSSSFLSYL